MLRVRVFLFYKKGQWKSYCTQNSDADPDFYYYKQIINYIDPVITITNIP